MTEVVRARLPALMLVSPALRIIYNDILILLFALAVFAILTSVSVATFIMALNPRAKRDWRHMTSGVYLVILFEILAYIFLLYSGVTIAELAFDFGPLIFGVGALLCAMAMRTRQHNKADIEKGS